MIVAKYEADENSLTMNDALLYERLVSRLLSIESLRRKVMNVRGRYRRMVSPEDYQGYMDGAPPNPLVAPAAEVLADLDDLLGRVQWVYVITPFRETMRSRLPSIRVVFALLVLIVVVAFLIRMRYDTSAQPAGASAVAGVVIPSLVVSVILGAIGGLVSVQQRVPVGTDGRRRDPQRDVALQRHVQHLPFAGDGCDLGGSAVQQLFIGGFLQGSLFPELVTDSSGRPLLDLQTFLATSGPEDGVAYAKLLIWSFIAGFAERFVPDTLSRLVGTVETPATSPPRSVAEPPPSHSVLKPSNVAADGVDVQHSEKPV